MKMQFNNRVGETVKLWAGHEDYYHQRGRRTVSREELELRAEMRLRGHSLEPAHHLSRDELHARHALR